jgi:hypothetical protein
VRLREVNSYRKGRKKRREVFVSHYSSYYMYGRRLYTHYYYYFYYFTSYILTYTSPARKMTEGCAPNVPSGRTSHTCTEAASECNDSQDAASWSPSELHCMLQTGASWCKVSPICTTASLLSAAKRSSAGKKTTNKAVLDPVHVTQTSRPLCLQDHVTEGPRVPPQCIGVSATWAGSHLAGLYANATLPLTLLLA